MADEVIARGLKAPTTQFRDRALGPVAEFDLGVLAGDTEFPFRIQLEQNKLAGLVLGTLEAEAALGELDAEVRFGWRAHAVIAQNGTAQGDDAVDGALGGTPGVRLLVGTADALVEVRAPWVIACDGAHSPVRESLGLELVGETYPERFLVASVDEEIRDHLPDLAYVNYIADPEEWLVLLRTPDHWRVLFPVSEGSADAGTARRGLLRGRRAGAAHRRGRPRPTVEGPAMVAVRGEQAGAAACASTACCWPVTPATNSPLGGMGMNSGIQDGVSAARRLAAVWHGEADESVLDEYDENRRRVATDHVQADSHAKLPGVARARPGEAGRVAGRPAGHRGRPGAPRWAKVERSA